LKIKKAFKRTFSRKALEEIEKTSITTKSNSIRAIIKETTITKASIHGL